MTIPSAGTYRLYLQMLGCYGTLRIDGKRIVSNGDMFIHGDITQAGQDNVLPTTDGLDNVRVAMELTAGPHQISVSSAPDSSNSPTQIRLNWVTPDQLKSNYAAAVSAAKQSKTAIVFAWSRGHPDFGLPGDQDQLISDVAAANPNTIVVLNVSQPIAMPWLSKVKAVLQMWWPGDEGGWATANLLLGKVNPSGRLPFTWASRLEEYPATDPRHPERSSKGVDGKTTYSEGIFEGYRWFDHQKIEPLFPFGHGLSYTTFAYSGLTVAHATDGGLDVSFAVKNTGQAAGDEVPQVYLGAPANPPQSVQFAEKALAAFDRVHLSPGESKNLTLHLPLRTQQYWSTAENKWDTVTSSRTVYVGSSSRALPLEKSTE